MKLAHDPQVAPIATWEANGFFMGLPHSGAALPPLPAPLIFRCVRHVPIAEC